METKVCSVCKEEKSLDEFNKRNSKSDKHVALCKTCHAEKTKQYRESLKEKGVQEGSKVCSKCGIEKQNTEFPIGKAYCRACGREMCKSYKQRNKGHISEYNKKYKGDHKEEVKEYNHDYNLEHREEIQKRQTIYQCERKKTDPQFKMACDLRTKLSNTMKGGYKDSSIQTFGCEYNFLCDWIKSQFTDEMSFENYGSVWNVDHVIPCARFNLINSDDRHKCFHWSNLRPFKYIENLERNNTLTKKELDSHINIVMDHIMDNGLLADDNNIVSYETTKYFD